MNGLEALYDIAVTCDSYGFEPTVPCEFDNIKNHHFAYLFKKQFAIIEKELKALELLRKAYNKEEAVFYVHYDEFITGKYFIDDYEQYHHLELTKEEYNLLKEVLKNE